MASDQGGPRPLEWTPELVQRFWNGMAKAGLDDAMAFGRMARRCIHWLIARHLVQGGRHLDYGAGSGEVAAYLISLGYPFAVLEPAIERQLKTEANLQGISGFLGDPGPAGSASFDAVTCFEVLEHVLDVDFERVCSELAGHVRPGGKLIISTPNNENLALSTVVCPVSNVSFHRWQHVRRMSAEFLTGTFARHGFRKVCVHQLDFFEPLFEPYLHMMGFDKRQRSRGEIIPLHIHQVMHDIDGVMGGASNLLYVGLKE